MKALLRSRHGRTDREPFPSLGRSWKKEGGTWVQYSGCISLATDRRVVVRRRMPAAFAV